jgi:hypothetical protein
MLVKAAEYGSEEHPDPYRYVLKCHGSRTLTHTVLSFLVPFVNCIRVKIMVLCYRKNLVFM